MFGVADSGRTATQPANAGLSCRAAVLLDDLILGFPTRKFSTCENLIVFVVKFTGH